MVLRMGWQRWVRDGVAVLLAAAAFLATFFPPPLLPLRWLPAAAAIVLAVMLIWSQRQVPGIPDDHVADLQHMGSTIQADLRMQQTIHFGDYQMSSQQKRHLENSFRAHFPGYARKLDDWDKHATQLKESLAAMNAKAIQVAAEEKLLPEAVPVLEHTARFYTEDVVPPVVAMNETAQPDRTTLISYGMSPVAKLDDPTAEQIAERKGQFQNLLGTLGTWDIVTQIRTERGELNALAATLAPEAARISMSHDLRVVSKCPICPKA